MIDPLRWWFDNDDYTVMVQAFVGFAIGLVWGPWAAGFFYLVLFIIVYEILYWWYNRRKPYITYQRAGVNCSYILGYIVGRTLSGDDVLVTDWSYLEYLGINWS